MTEPSRTEQDLARAYNDLVKYRHKLDDGLVGSEEADRCRESPPMPVGCDSFRKGRARKRHWTGKPKSRQIAHARGHKGMRRHRTFK